MASTKPTSNEAENGNKSKPLLYDISLLETGNYYRINGTKKKLYWDGEKWMKPQKISCFLIFNQTTTDAQPLSR